MTDPRRALALRDQSRDIQAARAPRVFKIALPLISPTAVLVLRNGEATRSGWYRLADDGTWVQVPRTHWQACQELVSWFAAQPPDDFQLGVEDARAAIAHVALDPKA